MKTSKLFFFAAVTAISLTACSKNSSVPSSTDPQFPSVKASLNAVAEDVSSSKATLDNLTLKWENGDKIALYQYGYYDIEGGTKVKRDDSKNAFTFNSSKSEFEGTVANYQPIAEEGSDYFERFYAGYPYDNIAACGITTGKYKVNVSASQTGLKADFGKYATYLGYIRQTKAEDPITSYEEGTLTFLKAFEMSCVTPIIKFNVPAALDVKQIVVSAYNGADPVNIAGQAQLRCDAKILDIKPTLSEITLSNGDNNIDGEVYLAIAPDNVTAENGIYKSVMDKLVLNLTKSDGATAQLSVSITSNPTSRTVKNLKSLPESVNWQYGKCPGVKDIYAGANSGNSGALYIIPDNANDTVYYAQSDAFATLGEPTTRIGSNGKDYIGNNGNVYHSFKIHRYKYDDCCEYAAVWSFTKKKYFGLYMVDNFITNEVGASAIQYDLTYTITMAGSTNAYPNCKSDGIDFMAGSAYSKGYLTFSAPQDGTARMIFQSTGSNRTVTVTNTTKSTNVQKSLGSAQGTVTTDTFAVSEGDVIKVEFSNSVTVNSMSFVWEPATKTKATLTESFSAVNQYGK